MFPHLMRHLRVDRTRSGRARTHPARRGSGRQGLSVAGDPFDARDYRGRNVVEHGFNLLTQWRSLATRYDKLAVVYRSATLSHAVIAWIKALSDTA